MNLINQHKYVAVENSNNLGFSIIAFQDIGAGEEIFVNYGSTYFEDEPNGCPCSTCLPANAVPIKDSAIIVPQALDVAGRHSANKIKHARQAENRRKKRQRHNEETAAQRRDSGTMTD